MKKLVLSLVLVMFTAIIFLGWSLDTLFNNYQEQQNTDEFSAYRQIAASLATTLDKLDDPQAFIMAWQKANQQTLNLVPLTEFPLPEELTQDFNQGVSLVLESADRITVNHIMPAQQQVLVMSVSPQASQPANLSLQMILTTAFYMGILLFVGIWLYPLIKRLRLLSKATKTFGAGDFAWRIPVSSTSYVADIENEFNRMAQKIETLIQDNKLLGNAVSHDLRTPLARLRFGIEALSETNKPEKQDKYIRHLSQDIAEMERLVEVLLNYARLEQSLIKVDKVPVDLNQLLDQCVYGLDDADGKLIKWQPIDKITIVGDQNFLAMLINNLLNNAQQYASQIIQVSIVQKSQSIELVVEDDGLGIDKSKRLKLLQPFTRGHNDIEKPGFGMGLAIVARIAAWHNAEIRIAESELGGARVSVTFKR
ncbi:ATP-binding protein [uncultured Paraglaciecola sp.]|jgi:signal transduction histidine kinase|uniref:ATP-binding protein n=1 Tax=uncultured Paraglaciecola sp. TaxID=1765024 RepID=UPI0025CE999D|nr:ATP-binding protein [uncultured Paraglaciecola sp.]